MNGTNVVWFRRNLRLHDNPALHSAIQAARNQNILAIFIFDTTFPETFTTFHHPRRFLWECVDDLNQNLSKVGGKLHIFKGCPLAVIRYLHKKHRITSLSMDLSREPSTYDRDLAIEALGFELGFVCLQHNCHNLWEPAEILEANGGVPPPTCHSFAHITHVVGNPPLPLPDADWSNVAFAPHLESVITSEFVLFGSVPSMSELGSIEVPSRNDSRRLLRGGESRALESLEQRLRAEESAFRVGLFQPNQARPDLMTNPPLAVSPYIAFGALSVRLFYWKVHEQYIHVREEPARCQPPLRYPPPMDITGQLVWREFFYTASRLAGPHFHQIELNPLCLPIPWDEDPLSLQRWKDGRTGYPFIDAGLRQLVEEGWIHHTVRNALAVFLTRGDLWLSWERGVEHFMAHLVDGDWAINAGNWLWISSSAFEKLLDCSVLIDPVLFGQRLEPSGDYIRRHVPELAGFPFEYVHEPWKAPIDVQQAANCIIGRDYPERMVIHEKVSVINRNRMKEFGRQLMLADKSNLLLQQQKQQKQENPKEPAVASTSSSSEEALMASNSLLYHPFRKPPSPFNSAFYLNEKPVVSHRSREEQILPKDVVMMANDEFFPSVDNMVDPSRRPLN